MGRKVPMATTSQSDWLLHVIQHVEIELVDNHLPKRVKAVCENCQMVGKYKKWTGGSEPRTLVPSYNWYCRMESIGYDDPSQEEKAFFSETASDKCCRLMEHIIMGQKDNGSL